MGHRLACSISGLTIGWKEPARAVLIAPTGEPEWDWSLYGGWIPVVPPLRVIPEDDESTKTKVVKEDKAILKLWKSWAKKHGIKLPWRGHSVADLTDTPVPSELSHYAKEQGHQLRIAYISEHTWQALTAEWARREENGNFLPVWHATPGTLEDDLLALARKWKKAASMSSDEGKIDAVMEAWRAQDRLRDRGLTLLGARGSVVQDTLRYALRVLQDNPESEDALQWIRGGVALKKLNTVCDGLHWRLTPCMRAYEISENRVARRILRDIVSLSEDYDRERHNAECVDPWVESQLHWMDGTAE